MPKSPTLTMLCLVRNMLAVFKSLPAEKTFAAYTMDNLIYYKNIFTVIIINLSTYIYFVYGLVYGQIRSIEKLSMKSVLLHLYTIHLAVKSNHYIIDPQTCANF